MKRCKVFFGNTTEEVENKINEWLRDNETMEILSLHYQRNYCCGHNVLIVFESNPYHYPPMPIQPCYPQPIPQYPITWVDSDKVKLYDDKTPQVQNPNPNPFDGTNVC